MSRHARIEEIDSSDEENASIASDPSEMDPSDFHPSTSSSLINPTSIPSHQQLPIRRNPTYSEADKERTKSFQCLYPIYFDKSRSLAQGRRVKASLAVDNPLARTIVDAIIDIGIPGSEVVFEPAKTHPRDWANPGRVRINRKTDKNTKRQFYKLVAQYLIKHPTTKETPLQYKIQGMMPRTDQQLMDTAPAIPKGWKMGTILPLHSPALSGGGVNENFFKDMMAGMQGGGPGAGMLPPGMADMMSGLGGMGGMGGMPGMGGAGPSAKAIGGPARKDKRKGK